MAERTVSAINLEAVHRASVYWSLCLHLIKMCHSKFPGIIFASFCHFAGAVACETNSDNLVATFHHPRSQMCRHNANLEVLPGPATHKQVCKPTDPFGQNFIESCRVNFRLS